MQWALAWAGAYLTGAVPFGLLIGRAKGVDLRTCGSRNIGATNCGRVLGRKYGCLCFVLDMLKGFGPVAAAGMWVGGWGQASPDPGQAWAWVGVMAMTMLGHMFPIYLKFQGGKGVATGFGAVLALWPHLTLPALGALVVWLGVLGLSRVVSLSSILAACSVPLSYALLIAAGENRDYRTGFPFLVVAGAMALLVVVRHRANLHRLMKDQEPRIGQSGNSGKTAENS